MVNYPKPATKQCTKKILEQINDSFYTIKEIDNKFGTCFFSYIKFKDKTIPVMISNYQIIRYLPNNKKIKISDNKKSIFVEFDKAKYINKKYNLSIIQIKENKKNKINYIELDDYLYEEQLEINFTNESIYTINYNNEKDISISYGIINNINNFEITYSCYLNLFNTNSKIFNLSNNKLIGIFKNCSECYNKGIFFNYFIKEFINEYKQTRKEENNNNEINILLNIERKDINKNIYFLDRKQNNPYLKEINKLNSELYINGIKKEFKNYFTPLEEDNYKIKLKFNINLIDCSYMFAFCENIKDINFIKFNTRYITNMKYMFHKCKKLKKINMLSLDTKYVSDMNNMFSFCENLEYLNLSTFCTKNVTDISYMLYYCINLNNLNLFKFPTENEINMNYMFEMCSQINPLNFNIKIDNTTINKYSNEINILIDVEDNDINEKIYYLDNFKESNQDNLIELNKLNTRLFINEKEKDFKKYFKPDKKGKYNIKVEFDIFLTDCSFMFAGCEKIIGINFIRFNTKHVTNMYSMFSGCKKIKNINLSSFDTKNVINMSSMFYNCENLDSLNLSFFDTKNVIDMSYMFCGCSSLNSLNLTSFDTKKVTNMSQMFYKCMNLDKINLLSFDTKKTTNMIGMFSYCNKLKELNLSSFQTSNVIDMSSMFKYCRNLNSINLSSFKTSNVKNMSGMFSFCNKLKNLNLLDFDTRNVTNMSWMFSGCINLNKLNLSLFDTKNVINSSKIFHGCARVIFDSNITKFNKFKIEDLL